MTRPRPAVPTRGQALAATLAAARTRGLPTADPVVLAEGYSLRVWLRPAPVVSRLVTVGRVLRGDPRPWLAREVEVATWLAARGAPVVQPWNDPGPHEAEGHPVSFWRHTPHRPGTVQPARLGALLGELHAHLAAYPAALPTLVGPLTDIAAARALVDHDVLHQAAKVLVPLVRAMPTRRPLHGDAHAGNVLLTPDGPRWTDFEDVCAGPAEWDLTSRTVSPAAVAAYPAAVDPGRLATLRELGRLHTLALLLTDDLQDTADLDGVVTGLRRMLARRGQGRGASPAPGGPPLPPTH